MKKPHVTRTYGQIHFEDLDPKRFEDLIRELIYDYKEWQNIEATGRSGNDDGFDIRGFEKSSESIIVDDPEEEEKVVDSKAGNLWMIQVKREKEIGPSRVKEILAEINKKNPPYGYILAASANFSKDSYDIFRSELQKIGVLEFHLWGKAELEDMLHQPKNDRILFTFFGISPLSRRRSKSTEIRFAVTNKNKIYRTFGKSPDGRSLLLRDTNDTKYPFKDHYKDFKSNPRWREYIASKYHPLGLVVDTHKHYAYIDTLKKEYAFSSDVSLVDRESDSDDDKKTQREIKNKIEDFWEHLPKANQAHFIRTALIRFDDMVVIDDKGDTLYRFPHIFTDFDDSKGRFAGILEFLEFGREQCLLDGYKQINIFPKNFSKPKLGKLHKNKEITLERHFLARLNSGSEDFFALYATDNK
jgi:hypothetical protein